MCVQWPELLNDADATVLLCWPVPSHRRRRRRVAPFMDWAEFGRALEQKDAHMSGDDKSGQVVFLCAGHISRAFSLTSSL